MFHHLKIIFRNIRRDGIYSVINIGGLAIGMAATMLIMLWVYNQWSYDRFHEKSKQLYQVVNYNEQYGGMPNVSRLLGPALTDNYPEVTDAARINLREETCGYGDKKLNAHIILADPGFLRMFSFPLTEGNPATAITDPHSIVLTRSFAERMFGNENPMGKTILVQAKYPVTVTGIMTDPPHNTYFRFDVMFPYQFMKELYDIGEDRWGNYDTFTYVELQPGTNVARLNGSIRDIVGKNTNGDDKSTTILQPVSEMHLYTKWENEKATGGPIETLRLFFAVAMLILLIACINFMNLNTARSERRAKEVGVRKVIGARKYSLVEQFLSESMLVTIIAAVFSIILVVVCLPFFNNLMNEQLSSNFGNIWFWLAFIGFIVITGLLAGSYPAFYLSSFMPVKVLKGVVKSGKNAATPRKALIVLQFTCAIVLIAATIAIYRQIQYAQGRNSGYDKDQLILLSLTNQMDQHQDLIRRELVSSGAALSVTRTLSPMTESWNSSWGIGWKGKDPENKTPVTRYYVDTGWSQTVGVTIVQGRDIDINTYPTDSAALLLNESAVKLMGFDDPIGEMIKDRRKIWHVVGVVKDFIIDSPYEPVRPMIVGGPGGFFGCLYIKLNGVNNMRDNLAKVEQVMSAYSPDFPFEYKFVDEDYARKFANEQRTGALAGWFAGLAVFISCLGLFGLSAYMAENRRKEIGIRKVLGASVFDITSLITKEFLILVSISIVIGIPVAWWLIKLWLAGYAYRISLSWWIFVVVALLTIIIALVTVGFQAIKAATTNPVKAIKAE